MGPIGDCRCMRASKESRVYEKTNINLFEKLKMNIKPLRNNVMFSFLDSSGGEKGKFSEVTKSGIILAALDSSQKQHRWGVVVARGPLCDGLEVGDYILVEALMWMEGVEVDGEKMWKTDDSKILLVTNDLESCTRQ